MKRWYLHICTKIPNGWTDIEHFSSCTPPFKSELPFIVKWKELRNSAPSFHWLSSSIFTYCSSSSRIRDTSSHLHYMMFQTIQIIYFLWGYDPGNMSLSFIAELSPVYCCLVLTFFNVFLCCKVFQFFWVDLFFISLSVSSSNRTRPNFFHPLLFIGLPLFLSNLLVKSFNQTLPNFFQPLFFTSVPRFLISLSANWSSATRPNFFQLLVLKILLRTSRINLYGWPSSTPSTVFNWTGTKDESLRPPTDQSSRIFLLKYLARLSPLDKVWSSNLDWLLVEKASKLVVTLAADADDDDDLPVFRDCSFVSIDDPLLMRKLFKVCSTDWENTSSAPGWVGLAWESKISEATTTNRMKQGLVIKIFFGCPVFLDWWPGWKKLALYGRSEQYWPTSGIARC